MRVLDSWNGLEVHSFTNTGPVLTNDLIISHPFLDFRGEIKCAGERYYAPCGRVYDLASDRVPGTFNVPGIDGWPNSSSGVPLVEPDVPNGRVFFLRYTGTNVTLYAFDESRHQLIGSMIVPGVSAIPSRLIRWGGDGVAFKTDKLFIVRSSCVPCGAEADLSLRLSGGANPGAQGQSESYSVSITNDGAHAATGIVATVSFSVGGIISGTSASQGSTVVSNLLLTWDVGSLAAGTSATADLSFTPATGGILKVLGSVSGRCRDRNPANDSDVHLEAVTNAAWFSHLTQLSLPVKDVVFDSLRSSLIASLHELGGVVGNSIIRLNPESGAISGPVFVGSSPNHLAMSTDGSRLFVGLDGASSVLELDAVTLQATRSFSISNGLRADVMAVVPGAAERLLVYRANAGLSIFDQGIEGSNKLSDVSMVVLDDMTGDGFGCNGSSLYRLAVDSNGVSVAQTLFTGLQQSGSAIKSENGLLYFDRGLVLSPALNTEVRRYPAFNFVSTGRVQPASDRHLVYFIAGSSGKWSLRAFRDTSAEPAGTFGLPGAVGALTQISRWGQTGLAFATSADQLFLLRDMFTSDRPMADVAIHRLSAPRTALPGRPLIYTCTITNRSVNEATATVVTQLFGFAGSFQQIQPSAGNVQTNGKQVVWSVGDLAGNASAQISVQLLPSTPQTITDLVVVASALIDPLLANNQAQAITPVRNYTTNALLTMLSLAAADMVYDPASKLLWASVTNATGGGALVPIDPIEGVVGPAIEVGSEVTRLGVAGDGIHLYGILPFAAGVTRINTTNSQLNQFTSAGFNPAFGFHTPLDISVSPTNPLQFAVSYYSVASSLSNFVGGVLDGAFLPEIGRDSAPANVIAYDSSAEQVYGFNSSSTMFQLSTFAATAAGFNYITNRTGLISGFNADIKHAGNRLYGSSGQVVDPRSGILLTNLATTMTATAVEPVEADNRLYFATKTPFTIRALNLTNFARLATNTLSGLSGEVRSLVRWGVDGLAMHTTGGQILILRSSLIPAPTGQDTDGDGMPDDWESRFGTSPYDGVDAALDLDGDGLSNLAEYLAGTDPYNLQSTLRIKRVSLQQTNLMLVFGSVAGRKYSIETCSDHFSANGWSTSLSGIVGTGGDITNQLAVTATNGFVRVRTQP